jgi:hypothetical protein
MMMEKSAGTKTAEEDLFVLENAISKLLPSKNQLYNRRGEDLR